MDTFPDLAGWEDSAQKIEAARTAVSALKDATGLEAAKDVQERSEKDRRKLTEELQEIAVRERQDLEQLKARLTDLAKAIGTQQAGYDFERWFFDLLDYEDIDNRKPYTVDGRQIDGSLTLDGTTYLVELKFEQAQAGAGAIDGLKARVNSKSDNTMGIAVCMSGYSSVAINEASGPKTAILLLDCSHIYLVLERASTLKEVIRRIRRHSSQTGKSYLAPEDFGG